MYGGTGKATLLHIYYEYWFDDLLLMRLALQQESLVCAVRK